MIAGHKRLWFFVFFLFVGIIAGCASKQPPPAVPVIKTPIFKTVAKIGFTIQAGAFTNQDNAVRLEKKLQDQGLTDAFYFVENNMYKVRFGNFETYKQALIKARKLQKAGAVNNYYIVRPETFTVNTTLPKSIGLKLVDTAENFIGIPYKWGGTSAKSGFDCSGLSMVVYKLNGVNLPRTSRMQYKAGIKISSHNLAAGDLVFFSTDLSGRINHVGIYKGNNYFIHAPRRGKSIKIASLNSKYFKARYVGARRYI